ncbi:MAG: penicillin acylase family protein [Ferruginibacter sp.]|nr:penicillin acylase family protein [Ferruginibacter sp.]
MRVLPMIISSVITTMLVVTLHTKLLLPAPLGKLLSPQHGVWQNAENNNVDFNATLKFPQLKAKVDVYLDDRLVPHVFAEQENDIYFVQGFLHAKFRLWQMELQTHAAAGRASEIVGSIAFKHDQEFRRLGMVYGAEASLKEMESDPVTKIICDAYTAGVNAYIATLTESSLPLEYKLIGYQPEKWSNLKSALFLKNMSENLAGGEDDFEMTNAKSFFSKEDFDKLYPLHQDSLDPVIPKGTVYGIPKLELKIPAAADSLYFSNKDITVTQEQKPDKDNGSNNWAVSGTKTKTGSPILCNDPHLSLKLPAIWFEMQLSTPSYNAYGVSFPGAPGIIIGFNDSCSWGVTNGGRDVRDYYEIKFRDDSRQEYWFDSAWKKTEFRYEEIRVRDSTTYFDTVAYTVFGPVMYDKTFSGDRTSNSRYFAVRWKAHDPSNELKAFILLNKAKNYQDYLVATSYMKTPGQNFVFASKSGDIAMRTQGDWPAKWKGQGDFIMPGTDSSYMWQGMIPPDETPFQFNPERNFVSSANQDPADSTYPYYLGRGYSIYRGISINRRLEAMENITPEDMMTLQTDNYNVFAEMTIPLFLKNISETAMTDSEKKYLNLLRYWDYNNAPGSKAATVFAVLWKNFDKAVFDDEFKNAPKVIMHPYESNLLEGILSDSAYGFVDNISTPQQETLADEIKSALENSRVELEQAEKNDTIEWAKYKGTSVKHLLRLDALSRLKLPIGGGTHCINAAKATHGPSWRMIISLTPQTTAYGVYPGGQSGNPGSRFYDNFIDKWAAGEYYSLWMMAKGEEKDKRVKWRMSFNNN